jgi:ATP-dependent RNA helicase DeaD
MHPVRIPSQDEILTVLQKAGFAAPTALQEKLFPLPFRGRDAAALRTPGGGATVGFMLPLILGLRGAGPEPRAVILAAEAADVGKMSRAYARFTRVVRDAPVFVPLGEDEDARREQRRLEKGATIVGGTVDRVIDHIRRGGLSFGNLAVLVIQEPGAEALADFVKDVQFILAKVEERPQTIFLGRSPLDDGNELFRLLRHPVVVDAAVPVAASVQGTGISYVVADARARAEVLVRVLLAQRAASAIVYCGPRADPRRLAEALEPRGLRPQVLGSRGAAERRRALLAFSRGERDVLLAPLGAGGLEPAERAELAPTHVIFYDLPPGGTRVAAGAGRGATIVALTDPGQEKELSRLQEAVGVAITRRDVPGDDEVLTGAIDRILHRIQTEDRDELGRLRSRIRRQVPLLQRPLFMASLLRSLLPPSAAAPAEPARPAAPRAPEQGRAPRAGTAAQEASRGRFGRNAAAGGRPSEGPAAPRPEPRPGTEGFTQLFVNVGRNRRVFARDLTSLFTETLSLRAGEIGDVRVFEKYSFVDIVPARAAEAIEKLSGAQVKGRTIAVNFANKKKEEKEES